MAVIGHMKTVDNFGTNILEGNLATLDFSIDFTLQENANKRSVNAPDYTILTKNASGAETQVGAAWKKTSQKMNASMREYISLSFDDPSFPRALHVKAFDNGDETWNVVWNRPQNNKSE